MYSTKQTLYQLAGLTISFLCLLALIFRALGF